MTVQSCSDPMRYAFRAAPPASRPATDGPPSHADSHLGRDVVCHSVVCHSVVRHRSQAMAQD
eukprot:10105633-Alexandrium_andersonii.AAC.1